MSFTAKDVAELRKITSAGMMDCKKALTETNGDMDEAVNYLRKKGIASASKKAGNIAAEGLVACVKAEDAKSAVMVEINCQTDFVAKTEGFQAFVKDVATVALNNKTTTLEALLAAELNGQPVSEAALAQTATTGEKVDIRRVEFVEAAAVGAYVHPVGSKIAALVALNGEATEEKANDIAMHVAAANPAPEFATRDEIPAEVIANETKVESEKEDLQGKPAEIIEKIVAGRVDKLLAARVLAEQGFIKDPNQKVAAYLGSAELSSFTRFNLGEGIEKKEENLAAEIAAMAAGN